ncbi:MAG TPA: NHLP leader peptide family RiPP precursor [Longimicrobium sp.]|nr:NHLP leader peptide family RiPP precursor [Longimicrobium sp.]
MSGNENPRSRYTEELLRRAASDPAFRQQLLSDPRSAVQHALGITVPEGIDLQVLEESANRVYLVLPAQEQESAGQPGAPHVRWPTMWGGGPPG